MLEVDGQEFGLDEDLADMEADVRGEMGRRVLGWKRCGAARNYGARKAGFGAIGRMSPSYCTQDACVPRSKLPEVIAKIAEICARHRLRITNVFHAGDGNVHPILMYDEQRRK